jgi:hypothetical protein
MMKKIIVKNESFFEYTKKMASTTLVEKSKRIIIPFYNLSNIDQIEIGDMQTAEIVMTKFDKVYLVDGTYLLTEDDYIIKDGFIYNSYVATFPNINDEKSLQEIKKDQEIEISIGEVSDIVEEGIYLGGGKISFFGHWIIEFLPRLAALTKKIECKKIIINDNIPESYCHFINLNYFGLSEYVKINTKSIVELRNCWFISCPFYCDRNFEIKFWLKGFNKIKERHESRVFKYFWEAKRR